MRTRLMLPLLIAALFLTACTMPAALPGAAPTVTLIPMPSDPPPATPTVSTEPPAQPTPEMAAVQPSPTATFPPAPTQAPPPAAAEVDYAATAEVSAPVAIEQSQSDPESIAALWEQAYQLPPGVPFSVTITEAQIESRIEQALALNGYTDYLRDVSVSLQNGQVIVTFSFEVTVGAVTRTPSATAAFAVALDANGEIVVTLVSASAQTAVGTVQIPPEYLSVLNTALTEALVAYSDYAGSSEYTVVLTGLTIANGSMTVTGYVTV